VPASRESFGDDPVDIVITHHAQLTAANLMAVENHHFIRHWVWFSLISTYVYRVHLQKV